MNKIAIISTLHFTTNALQSALDALAEVADESTVRHHAKVATESIRGFVDFLYKPDEL